MFDLEKICETAKNSSRIIGRAGVEAKNKALLKVADALCANKSDIIKANKIDMTNAEENNIASLMRELNISHDFDAILLINDYHNLKACIKAGKKLTLIGEGPEHENLVKAAGDSPLITFKSFMTTEDLAKELGHAKAFIFPSMEPFGIAPVEALAAGCPVIAFKEGGATDYVIDGKNGLLFEKQTVDSLVKTIEEFEKKKFDRKFIEKSAKDFDIENFKKKLQKFINEKVSK